MGICETGVCEMGVGEMGTPQLLRGTSLVKPCKQIELAQYDGTTGPN